MSSNAVIAKRSSRSDISLGPRRQSLGSFASNSRMRAKYEKVLADLSSEADRTVWIVTLHKYGVKLFLVFAYFLFVATFYSIRQKTCENRSDIYKNKEVCSQRHWSVLESFYFGIITAFTVGFTDFYPSDDGGKIATIFVIICGIYLVGTMLGVRLIYEKMLFDNSCTKRKFCKII